MAYYSIRYIGEAPRFREHCKALSTVRQVFTPPHNTTAHTRGDPHHIHTWYAGVPCCTFPTKDWPGSRRRARPKSATWGQINRSVWCQLFDAGKGRKNNAKHCLSRVHPLMTPMARSAGGNEFTLPSGSHPAASQGCVLTHMTSLTIFSRGDEFAHLPWPQSPACPDCPP